MTTHVNSHSEIKEKAPFDRKILRGCIEDQFHMVENEKKFKSTNVNMQVESQTDLNMVEKQPMVSLLGLNLLSKEKKMKPFDFDLNVDLIYERNKLLNWNYHTRKRMFH